MANKSKRTRTRTRTHTRKRRSSTRKTYKKRTHGGHRVIYYLVHESPTRKKYPVFRMIPSMIDEEQGAIFRFNDFVRDTTYDVEDYLASLKMNRGNVVLPNKVYIKKHRIMEPEYFPGMKL